MHNYNQHNDGLKTGSWTTAGNIFPDNEAISPVEEILYLNLALVAITSVMVLHVSIYH